MTLQEVIAMADELKPNAFSPSVKVAWINALEGRIALSVFLMSEADAAQLHYTTEDLNETLLVKPPYDDIYELWLEAKIDYANGEYDKYQNTMAEYNAHYGEFVRWFAEKYRPAQPHCGCPRLPEYYISAYSLAVNAGFAGTLEEWLQSLHGQDGVDGTVGTLFYPQVVNGVLSWSNDGGYENPAPVNIAGPGEKGEKGDTGATGAAGADGISPRVSVTTISNGHRITIIDAAHPAENPLVFDVIDGTGAGDMRAATYDPTNKAQDIFAYVDALGVTNEAKTNWAAGIKHEATATLLASGWTEEDGIYSQTVSVTGMPANGPVIVQPTLTADDAATNETREADFAKATRLKPTQEAGSLTFRTDEAPEYDLALEVAF